MILRILSALALGGYFGIIGSQTFFVGSALSLIPWAIVGLVIGWGSYSNKEAVIKGVVYGFTLSFTFMVSEYTGIEPLSNKLPFFVLLGIFGAFCGASLGLVSYLVKTKFL